MLYGEDDSESQYAANKTPRAISAPVNGTELAQISRNSMIVPRKTNGKRAIAKWVACPHLNNRKKGES